MDTARGDFERALQLTRSTEDIWLTAQALRELAATELENDHIDAGIKHVLEAEALCREVGMNDLLVGVRALAGRLHLRAGMTDEALEWSMRAMREIRPGVELAHLVPLALSEVHLEMGDEAESAHYIEKAHEQLSAMLADLPPEAQAMAWNNIPNHRAIEVRWSALQPQTETFALPLSEAPIGRPLQDGEIIDVEWTIHEPADDRIGDKVERRRHQLLRLISEAKDAGALPTVGHLAQALQSSEATIRRDLSALRSEGIEATTRGSR
jgi:DNA-binding transcriptional ArsR family regulator